MIFIFVTDIHIVTDDYKSRCSRLAIDDGRQKCFNLSQSIYFFKFINLYTNTIPNNIEDIDPNPKII